MTVQQLRDRIAELLGDKYISECEGRYFLQFDSSDDLTISALPNFTLEELLTKNKVDTFTKLELGVLVLLQTIRDEFGYPVVVSSSYRSKTYNKSKSGATASRHMIGDAIDSHPKDSKRLMSYKKLIMGMDIPGGMGIYPQFVHIDTRPWKARWY
jgi:uncharacterized protein YcbK (DUF882 family)